MYNPVMTRREYSKRARDAVLSSDTSLEVERRQVDLWRRMSPADKLRAVREMTRAVQELSLAGIRSRHPGASEDECKLRLALLTLGRDLACRVFPDASSLTND